jgi:hypothetical protein
MEMDKALIDLACSLGAAGPDALNGLGKEEMNRHIANTKQIFTSAQEIRELPDGYSLRLPDVAGGLANAAAFIAINRLCCSHLRHALVVEPQSGPVWLQLTGGPGVKELLATELSAFPDLPNEVAIAAGLRPAAAG